LSPSHRFFSSANSCIYPNLLSLCQTVSYPQFTRIMTGIDCVSLDGTAIVDQLQEGNPPDISTKVTTLPLPTSETSTPLPELHDHEAEVAPSRCDQSLPSLRLDDPASHLSAVSSSSTAQDNYILPSAEGSTHFQDRFCTLRWRLASGYFAYYILSWADGGKPPQAP
jgi:hypothetical protein